MSGEPAAKIAKMATTLDQLKGHTVVVADTGDFEGKNRPQTLPKMTGYDRPVAGLSHLPLSVLTSALKLPILLTFLNCDSASVAMTMHFSLS